MLFTAFVLALSDFGQPLLQEDVKMEEVTPMFGIETERANLLANSASCFAIFFAIDLVLLATLILYIKGALCFRNEVERSDVLSAPIIPDTL